MTDTTERGPSYAARLAGQAVRKRKAAARLRERANRFDQEADRLDLLSGYDTTHRLESETR